MGDRRAIHGLVRASTRPGLVADSAAAVLSALAAGLLRSIATIEHDSFTTILS
ncbi:MAG TPA: hypothetical protein VNL70_01750 [Tepidisphaeraceae bacterium]|nr:hypothetical protein [Tepidisphaeraceae bacterium]